MTPETRPHPLALALQNVVVLDDDAGLTASLDAILGIVRQMLDGIDEAGISLMNPFGRLETKAATGPLAWQLGAVEAHIAQGPCRDVATDPDRRVIVIDRLEAELRWPRYVRRARPLGLQAQVAVALLRGEAKVGVLNLCSTQADADGEAISRIAEAFMGEPTQV